MEIPEVVTINKQNPSTCEASKVLDTRDYEKTRHKYTGENSTFPEYEKSICV